MFWVNTRPGGLDDGNRLELRLRQPRGRLGGPVERGNIHLGGYVIENGPFKGTVAWCPQLGKLNPLSDQTPGTCTVGDTVAEQGGTHSNWVMTIDTTHTNVWTEEYAPLKTFLPDVYTWQHTYGLERESQVTPISMPRKSSALTGIDYSSSTSTPVPSCH